MGYRKKHIKGGTDGFRNEPFQVRSMINQRKRKSEMRTKVVLFSTAVLLVVILAVLAFKLNGLNMQDGSGNVAAADTDSDKADGVKEDSREKKKDSKDNEKEPVKETMASGKKRWLRDGLDPDKPMVALTFDDGPYTPVTSRILKVLKKYDARATFFIVGNRVPSYEDMVKQAYEQGNEIATHTYNHANLTKLSKKQIRAELDKSKKVIKDVIGCSFSALRPPGGSINDTMRSTVKVPMIYWSVDTEDWKSRNKKSVLNECKVIQDGDIVLMHDLYPSTADAVEKLVPKLVKEGYQLVTVDELLYYNGIKAEAGKVYANGR
jgi:Predicted xylanase/chitin deacetylase